MSTAATPEDLLAIRAAEDRIAERLATAARSDDELTAARECAARIVAEAEVAAEAEARSLTELIDADSQQRCAAEEARGRQCAERVMAIAESRRSHDVSAVLSVILAAPTDVEPMI